MLLDLRLPAAHDCLSAYLFGNNQWMVAQHKPRREWSPPQVISSLGCLDLIDGGATCIPAWLRDEGLILS